MRILIFTEVFVPNVCGISSYVEVLKKGLENLSHTVLIVTSSPNVEKAYYKKGVIICPAKIVNNKYGHECKKIDDPNVLKFLCNFKPDVVHIHTDTKIGYMGLEVGDISKAKIVYTIHDYFLDRFANENKFVWMIKTIFEKKHFIDMLDTADEVTSSCIRADIFVRRAKRKNKVQIVPCGVDKELFNYTKFNEQDIKNTRKKYNLSSTSTVAVFAGSLSIEKNLEFALSSFSKYITKDDNIQFLIVGDGTETEYLKNICKKLNIDDIVLFAGTIPNKNMPEIYSACDMYVCSYDDGLMSMSFGEAMSCGLPVLIKEDREKIVYEMIQDGVNGFVYKSEEEFANYLKMFSTLKPTKVNRIKSIVRNTISRDSCTEMAKKYIDIYKNIEVKRK